MHFMEINEKQLLHERIRKSRRKRTFMFTTKNQVLNWNILLLQQFYTQQTRLAVTAVLIRSALLQWTGIS